MSRIASNVKIVGITGTLGAGKGTVVDILCKKFSYVHYSVRSYLLDVIAERNMPPTRDSMRVVANDLRASNSPSFIVEQLLEKAITASSSEKGSNKFIIESIRTPGEVTALRERCGEFILLAVDADERVRFDRIRARASETDFVDFETWRAQERAEMTNTDPNKQNLFACMEVADVRIANDGGLDALETKVKEAFGE